MAAIEVKGLTVFRGKKQILKDLSFSVEEGSFTVLSGPSGCGKSTVLLAIQGLLGQEEETTVSGEILVDGKAVKLTGREDGDISLSGFLMQNVDAQIVNLLSGDELVFGMENRGFPRSEMEQQSRIYTQAFDLIPEREVLHLSGGQKQRLLIASCLCTGHRVILLDEPFANLDQPGVHTLLTMLKEACHGGVTVLCVEHRLEEVCSGADQLLWLENGELQAYSGEQISAFAKKQASILEVQPQWNQAAGEACLSVDSLTARRGSNPVFSDDSISLRQNTCTLLLGRNGSGKTTLMRILCGLAPGKDFCAAHFTYMGENCLGRFRYPKLRRKVGFVFQNPVHQLFMKTVEEELLLRCNDPKTVKTVLETFGISHLADRHPYGLSMGEKRRVSVAAAAASGAKLILLDEPTIGQDYRSLRDMALSLNRLQAKTGNTLLISTHDTQAIRLFGGKCINLDSRTPVITDYR